MPTRSSLIPRRPRALLVSHRAAAAQSLVASLSRELCVTTVEGTDEATRHLSEQGAQLIIVDLSTARAAFVDCLRTNPETARIPVLAFGKDESPFHVVAAIRAGARGYISEPVRGSSVLTRVRSVLAKRAS